MDWNEDERDVVRACWADGWSAGRIAVERFPEKTRSAVAGLIHRMGLPKRGPRISARKKAAAQIVLESPDSFKLDKSYPNRKTLLELTDTCCRWPVGDPLEEGFFFCGAVKLRSITSYCGYHELLSRGSTEDQAA